MSPFEMLRAFAVGCLLGLAGLAIGHVATKAIASFAYEQAN